MDWWNSFEAISKAQTGLAVALAVLAFVTLTFKIRGDHLRKIADARRAEDRTVVNREEEPKAAESPIPVAAPAAPEPPAPVAPIEHPPEAAPPPPIAPTRRHFPKEKTDHFLQVLSHGITGPMPLTLGYVEADDGEPREFASEFATLFGGDPSSMNVVAPSNPPVKGIMIQDSSDAQSPTKFAANLIAAFEAVGFKCSYGKGSPKLGVVRIVVGPRE